MNAYFRMSNEIFMCPAVIELSQKSNGDSNSSMRVLIFIRILSYSVSAVRFVDAKMLSTIMGVAVKQAQRVWDVCMNHGVLRQDGMGYSAREWLSENGYFGTYSEKKEEKKPENNQDSFNKSIQAYIQALSSLDEEIITNKNKCELIANQKVSELGFENNYSAFLAARTKVMKIRGWSNENG